MKKKLVIVFMGLMVWSVASVAAKEKTLWKDLYVDLGDIKMHYLDTGTGDRVLVLIPGWTLNAEVWKEQIPYFSARGFRVIAMDPRSQGLTTKTDAGNTYHQHAADLHAFLQSLKIEHSYLIGWGSGVAALVDYISSPEALKPEKMVFVEGGPAILKMEDYPGIMTVQQARQLVLAFADDREKGTDQYIRSLFRQRPPEILVNELIKASLKTPLSAAISLFFDLFTADRRSALLHVPVPSLIVTTTENQAIGEYMKNKIPRSSLEVIEGAGPAIFLDKPQAFNQIVEDFLGEH